MTKESTIQPFAAGDILVGATVLNNPDDDHAGDGRIIQYDSDLNEKGVLWTEGTSHLIGGLRFGPDNTLWAFDSAAYAVMNIDTNGKQTTLEGFPKKSFSNVCFTADGNVIVGEHLVGNEIKLPPERPLGTTLPLMPGSDLFGEGHTFRCSPTGDVLKEYATETHGGMPGFLGVNSTALSADGKTFLYLSELGNRVFRYDLEAEKQLDDLITYDPESGDMAMCLVYQPDGQLLLIQANFRKGFNLHKIDENGNSTQEWPMPGPGWAAMGTSTDANIALIGNFFTGAVAKFDLSKGEIVAQAETGVERALAGIAQFPG